LLVLLVLFARLDIVEGGVISVEAFFFLQHFLLEGVAHCGRVLEVISFVRTTEV
jgi:hypothetical protein